MHMLLANNVLEKNDHDNIYPQTLFAKNGSKTPNCCNFLVYNPEIFRFEQIVQVFAYPAKIPNSM